eukprot:TRINITY_DN59192_c0_g1_i1.p1 TRINITY_DN59192_c0_g1~~TRINITY_DN59192_c0_g1_i1.p1  ORF type:complete len:128 (-),score=16.18 TRINITY_DN59192_c0_g1_i1:11-394(-)
MLQRRDSILRSKDLTQIEKQLAPLSNKLRSPASVAPTRTSANLFIFKRGNSNSRDGFEKKEQNKGGKQTKPTHKDRKSLGSASKIKLPKDTSYLPTAMQESLQAPSPEIGRAVQQECRDRSRMPSSA